MTAVIIRQAGSGDLVALREIYRSASLSNAGDRPSLLANPAHLLWPDALAAGRTRLAVESDGTAVGFATTVLVAGELELEDLFVAPAKMRQGIARHLIDDVRAIARAQGFASLHVTANPHALAFYQAVGFVAEGQIKTQLGYGLRMRLDCRLGER